MMRAIVASRVETALGPWKQYVFSADGNHLTELRRPSAPGGQTSVEREYVWLGHAPLAQVEYTSGVASTNYFHLDHLGAPRVLTSETGATIWSAEVRPFGEALEGSASVVTNLRLPGQYDERLFQATGINLPGPYYNWNRWYLPGVGRYLEPDPIAIAGGFNGEFGPDWYGYALQNPMNWVDRFGLYPGQFPPAPPGYDPAGWQQGQWPNGRWYLTSPDGRRYTIHPEDDGHWRHWDIKDKDGNDRGSWPPSSDKPWPTQKRKPKPNQCTVDPSGDAPDWTPVQQKMVGCTGFDGDPCWTADPLFLFPDSHRTLLGGFPWTDLPMPTPVGVPMPEPVPVY
jgi:RHS repeat-associated protein